MAVKAEHEFLESADVALLIERTPAAVNAAADAGRLRIAARTRRGTRLFVLEDVRTYLAAREPRIRVSAGGKR
jgi:hypothetical protein